MRRTFLFIIVFSLFVPVNGWTIVTKWKPIKKGLWYTEASLSPAVIHAFKIDPKYYKFGVVTARDLGTDREKVREMARKKGALLAINGGFFTPEYEALGLLVNDGKVINPLKKMSWWSIFLIKNDVPYIVHTSSFNGDPNVSMAIQSGPRLVVDGHIPKLKPSVAERSVVCININGEVIVAATEKLLSEPREFADFLRKSEASGGLGCMTALNLDGGSSTQMYARVGSLEIDIPGINKVANAVVVFPKR